MYHGTIIRTRIIVPRTNLSYQGRTLAVNILLQISLLCKKIERNICQSKPAIF